MDEQGARSTESKIGLEQGLEKRRDLTRGPDRRSQRLHGRRGPGRCPGPWEEDTRLETFIAPVQGQLGHRRKRCSRAFVLFRGAAPGRLRGRASAGPSHSTSPLRILSFPHSLHGVYTAGTPHIACTTAVIQPHHACATGAAHDAIHETRLRQTANRTQNTLQH